MLKTFDGVITGSAAVIMDAVNNFSDVLSSVITIVGTKLAGKAPDKKHPYGYGQIEYVSSVTIAAIVLLAGLTSFKESVDKVIHPVEAEYTIIPMVIIAVADNLTKGIMCVLNVVIIPRQEIQIPLWIDSTRFPNGAISSRNRSTLTFA